MVKLHSSAAFCRSSNTVNTQLPRLGLEWTLPPKATGRPINMWSAEYDTIRVLFETLWLWWRVTDFNLHPHFWNRLKNIVESHLRCKLMLNQQVWILLVSCQHSGQKKLVRYFLFQKTFSFYLKLLPQSPNMVLKLTTASLTNNPSCNVRITPDLRKFAMLQCCDKRIHTYDLIRSSPSHWLNMWHLFGIRNNFGSSPMLVKCRPTNKTVVVLKQAFLRSKRLFPFYWNVAKLFLGYPLLTRLS